MRGPGWVLLAGTALVSAPATSCGAGPCGPGSGQVLRVIDGDTLELASGEKVRYLLVDAPESTGGKNECFGREAATRNRELVEGKAVALSYDSGACTDRFGRLLAYVKVDGVEVNRALVEQGYACTLFVAPAGSARREEFEVYEAAAKTDRRGMWGQCRTAAPSAACGLGP